MPCADGTRGMCPGDLRRFMETGTLLILLLVLLLLFGELMTGGQMTSTTRTTWDKFISLINRRRGTRARPGRCRRAGGPPPPSHSRRGMRGRRAFRIRPARGNCARSWCPGEQRDQRAHPRQGSRSAPKHLCAGTRTATTQPTGDKQKSRQELQHGTSALTLQQTRGCAHRPCGPTGNADTSTSSPALRMSVCLLMCLMMGMGGAGSAAPGAAAAAKGDRRAPRQGDRGLLTR